MNNAKLKLEVISPTSIKCGNVEWFALDTKLVGKVKALEEENKKLKEEYITLEKDYGTCELENSKLRSEIIELEEENERLKAEIDLLNDNRHYLNNKIGKAIIFIRKNIELNNGALSNREELIVSKHDLIKNETDVLNHLINILKGEDNDKN